MFNWRLDFLLFDMWLPACLLSHVFFPCSKTWKIEIKIVRSRFPLLTSFSYFAVILRVRVIGVLYCFRACSEIIFSLLVSAKDSTRESESLYEIEYDGSRESVSLSRCLHVIYGKLCRLLRSWYIQCTEIFWIILEFSVGKKLNTGHRESVSLSLWYIMAYRSTFPIYQTYRCTTSGKWNSFHVETVKNRTNVDIRYKQKFLSHRRKCWKQDARVPCADLCIQQIFYTSADCLFIKSFACSFTP